MQCWHIPKDTEYQGTLHYTCMATPTIHVFQQLKQTSSHLCKSECDACSTILPHCLICVAPHWQGKTLAEGWQHFMWHVRTEHDQGATVLSVQTGQSMYWNLNRNILQRGPNKTETHNHDSIISKEGGNMYQNVMGTKACNMHAKMKLHPLRWQYINVVICVRLILGQTSWTLSKIGGQTSAGNIS